jgi:hypothetical protein
MSASDTERIRSQIPSVRQTIHHRALTDRAQPGMRSAEENLGLFGDENTDAIRISSQTSAQDRAEFHCIDVTTRYDAGDLSGACLAGQGTRHRAGAGALGDHAVSLG